VGSIPDEAIAFFSCNSSSCTVADSASNRNEYQESSWGIKGGQPARKSDNLTVICEPIV
jgi:hypothetical protein